MQRLARIALWLCAALVLGLGSDAASAADRTASHLTDIDLPGFDYAVEKGVSLDQCEAACVDDRICRAFTYNAKAKWCFLKGGAGEQAAFKGATSGIIALSPSEEERARARAGELPFPADDLVGSARYFAQQLPLSDPPPPEVAYADLVASGDEAVAQSNPAAAWVSYRQALAVNRNDPALWLKLADVATARGLAERAAGNSSYEFASTTTYAAISAYLLSDGTADRAAALAALARGLALREMWRESIASYRASVALVDDATLQAELDRAVAEHGFRIASNQVDSESATPRICVVFSEALPAGSTDLASYVTVEGAPQVAVETEQSQICVTGVDHGRRYHLKFRAGLPSAYGEQLRSDVALDVYVPDRTPFVGFANNAYVLPAGLGGGLPITSVNTEKADVVIYRIGDRSIAAAVRNGVFQRTLDGYSAEDVANNYGELTWEGQLDLSQTKRNEMAVTAVPVADVLGDIPPGAYVITAKPVDDKSEYWQEMATQWFIVTDLGLTTLEGDDGVHAFVRSLASAQAVAGAKVRLIAVNNEVLGEATTDADGRADFAPGLARGEGGRAPQLLVAETAEGDFAFLDVTKPAFDLTDRGVEGRPTPGPLDLFLTTERGVYRPGETVFLTGLLRDSQVRAVEGLPLTVQFERPDGVVASREVLADGGAGGYFAAVPLVEDAMRGSWQVRAYADPDGEPLASVGFLVEDFEPERLAFEVSASEQPVALDSVTPVSVAARYLYGAIAPNLSVEADAIIRPVDGLAGFAGYSFGRWDDSFETTREPLGEVGVTGEDGTVVAEVLLPSTESTTRPLEAQILMRLVDSNGRTVERSLRRPVLAQTDRIGIRPQFEDATGLAEGTSAGFDIITVAPEGGLVARAGLTWTLSRIETNYQWYRQNNTWKWEAITTTRQVADGTIDTLASGPATIAAPVQWGSYRLEVNGGGDAPTSSTYQFYAGYYYAEAGSDTPDTLSVALDKAAYHPGETASLRLDPQFAGTALVMVVDDRIIDMKAVEVPAEGTTVDLPVTDAWGPGAYVTAVLYRPSSDTEKRMPARALGLAFADVEPGDQQLDVGIEAEEVSQPRRAFTAKVSLGNVAAGETAYVAVAAVDLGILNLTSFPVPDPDGWYFGQRQLGMAIRDLYGQLIDPTQGDPGALHSGGDGGGSRLGTPPSISVLLAMHSGIVEVGADGTATVSFDMPDFNGTVRLMAMAWTGKAVGHASKDVIVRDPVVVNLSPPRFLRLDDSSRLLVEIDNVGGPAGTYEVELLPGTGLETDAPRTTVDLAVGDRTALELGLRGTALGDQPLKLIVTDPSGNALVKDLTLGVRASAAPETASRLIPLEPGASVTLDAAEFADMLAGTGTLTFAVGPIARLDVPGLLLSLDRYPYGCAEQVSSRAFPLLYLNEVAQLLGLGTDEALDQRIRDAIANVLAKQTSAGSFGLWGPLSSTDLWLDAYVTEFLLRAGAEGYAVPDTAMTMALDNLSNQLAYASDFSSGGEGIAYALYDLARAGRAAIGDLRYYLEARLEAFTTPLGKAQLGAALALYGDRTRAATAFKAAVEALDAAEARHSYRVDYGSKLRDTAAVLALAAEFKPSGVDLAALTERLADQRELARYTSTQEDAWTLVAAAALAREAESGAVTIDGEALDGTVYRRYQQEYFDGAGVTIANTGNQPTEIKLSVTGIPATPPPARSEGFTFERTYYRIDGTPADLGLVGQNDRFVVVLSMSATTLGSGQYVVADPLPAGFEIENPDLSAAGGVGELSWLAVNVPDHVESRTDQYVAAFRYYADTSAFSTAYMVRATTPGSFVMPGATIEDMYRPELRANTASGTIEVGIPGP